MSPVFFQNKIQIKTNDFMCFFIDPTFFVTPTVYKYDFPLQIMDDTV